MKKKKLKFSDVLIYFFLLFCGIICLVPILNTIAISFSDRTSAAMGLVKLTIMVPAALAKMNMTSNTQNTGVATIWGML